MDYVSTRGHSPTATFAEVTLAGLAPDGGLYVPASVPALSGEDVARLRSLSYADVAAEVIGRFVEPELRPAIARVCAEAYRASVFGTEEVVPVTELEPGLHLLHLSNGPTLAFKDMAMQFLGRLFDELLVNDDDYLMVLGATSGDTGSAGEHAVVGRQRVAIVMLSPRGRVSPFQAAQMYTLDEPNILNIAIEGVFDEAQDLVKTINADAEFKRTHHIGAVNSINWARVAAQIVYYVWGYLRVAENGEPVTFSVPTGNFGNIYAGLVAQRMGLPLQFVLATNENDVLAEFFATGRYRVRSKAEVAATSSPSMDIAKASNFERFIHDVSDDASEVASLWSALERTGGFDIATTPMWQRILDRNIVAGSSTHSERLDTIREIDERHGRIVDPHTADGLNVGRRLAQEGAPLVCLETALPTKFEATIQEALGRKPHRPLGFEGLEDRPQHVEVMAPDSAALRTRIERFTATWRG